MIQKKIYNCVNKECTEYHKDIEVLQDTKDTFPVTYVALTCEKCGEDLRTNITKTFGTSYFHIDELALGTKRMFDKPKQ